MIKIKKINEKFSNKNYKVNSSLQKLDYKNQIISGDKTAIFNHETVFIESENKFVNLGKFNEAATFEEIETQRSLVRNPESASELYNHGTPSDTTAVDENIPFTAHIQRIEEDFIDKFASFIREKLERIATLKKSYFDDSFCPDSVMETLNEKSTYLKLKDNRFVDSSGVIKNSGFIYAENIPNDLQIFMYIRKIPIPLRKTVLAKDANKTTKALFIFPYYLLKQYLQRIYAIEYMKVVSKGTIGDTTAFSTFKTDGKERLFGFKEPTTTWSTDKMSNTNVINKPLRNLETL